MKGGRYKGNYSIKSLYAKPPKNQKFKNLSGKHHQQTRLPNLLSQK
jgi:hypothetical protein